MTLAVALLCTWIHAVSLSGVDVAQRECERIEYAFPTNEACRAYLAFMAALARQPGKELLMGICFERSGR